MSIQLSYSKIKTYISCPKSYELLYIKKVKPIRQSEALKVGSEIHRALERTFQLAKSIPLFEAFQTAIAELSSEVKQNEKVKTILETFKPEMVFGKSIIQTGASELRIGLSRDLMPDKFETAAFRGIIDLMWMVPGEDGLEANILDFKTNVEKTADTLQLEFYAFLVKNFYKLFYNISNIRVMFYYLMHDEPLEILEFRPTQVEDIKFLQIAERIETDNEFNPKPGAACKYCSVAYACPFAKEGFAMLDSEETTRDDKWLLELAERFPAMKRAVEVAESLIREYLETNEQLVTQNFVYKYVTATKRIIDPEYAREVLKLANVSIDDLIQNINLSQALFKKLNIQLPDDAFITKEETRLEIKGLEED